MIASINGNIYNTFVRTTKEIMNNPGKLPGEITLKKASLRAIFTKFLTPGLTRKLGSSLDDWLD